MLRLGRKEPQGTTYARRERHRKYAGIIEIAQRPAWRVVRKFSPDLVKWGHLPRDVRQHWPFCRTTFIATVRSESAKPSAVAEHRLQPDGERSVWAFSVGVKR
jgi:hypothetical protein